MTLNEYQAMARQYATGGGSRLDYALLGLAEECGELLGKVAKFVRKTNLPPNYVTAENAETIRKLALEVGDCLWMISSVSHVLGLGLDEVARMNLDKLRERKAAGVICGNGDTTDERLRNAEAPHA